MSNFIEKIICISEYSKQEYVKSGVAANKCITIYNGVDINRFSLRKISNNNFINIGNIGRLEEWKGQHIFIKAIPIVATCPNVRFLIVGSGSQKDRLIQLANDLNILNYINFSNSIENIEDVFKT